MPGEYSADWTTKLAFIREHGIVSAAWDASGNLTSVVVDAAHTSPSTAATTQRKPPEVAAQEERDRRRDVLLGSASRLRGSLAG